MREKKRSNYDLSVYNSPQYKMGIKIMDLNQLKNVFPQYENIMAKIEEYRNNNIRHSGLLNSMDRQDNVMFDNVFSIMGQRGSGKTSVLYTLKKMIERDNPYDMVLPIVMPELVPESSEMIEWILALFEEKITEISERLREKRRNESDFFKDCRAGERENLGDKYRFIKSLCSFGLQQGSMNTVSEIASWREKYTQDRFNLSQELVRFWTMLIKSIQGTEEQYAEKMPLIYVMFDDVDMEPKRIWELMSVIIKYLAHPNVIVILTADEEMLYRTVKSELIKKIHDEDFSDLKYLDEMTRRYAGKILPPATRYYLKNFETCLQKKNFIFQLNFDADGKVNGRVDLQKYVKRIVAQYVGKEEDKTFLCKDGEFIDIYLMFWGNTARQIGNGCLILNELITNLNELSSVQNTMEDNGEEKYLMALYQIVHQFVLKILTTNSSLYGDYSEIKSLVNELIIYHPKEWGIYLNYNYIYKRTMEMQGSNDIEKSIWTYPFNEKEESEVDLLAIVKENIALYILLYFIENILIEEGKKRGQSITSLSSRNTVHGQVSLVSLLDHFTASSGDSAISLVRRNTTEDNMASFLYSYGKVLENPEVLMDFELTDPMKVREYIYSLDKNEDTTQELLEYHKNNPIWFKSIVQLLYLAKKGFYNIPKRKLQIRRYDKEFRLFDQGLTSIREEYMDKVQNELLYTYGKGTEEFRLASIASAFEDDLKVDWITECDKKTIEGLNECLHGIVFQFIKQISDELEVLSEEEENTERVLFEGIYGVVKRETDELINQIKGEIRAAGENSNKEFAEVINGKIAKLVNRIENEKKIKEKKEREIEDKELDEKLSEKIIDLVENDFSEIKEQIRKKEKENDGENKALYTKIMEIIENKFKGINRQIERELKIKIYKTKGKKRYDSITEIQIYIKLLKILKPEKSETIINGVKCRLFDMLLSFLQEEIVKIRNKFIRYEIKNKDDFLKCIEQMQGPVDNFFDRSMIKDEKYIDIRYMNAVMRTILRGTYQKELAEGFKEPELSGGRSIYRKITTLLDVDVSEQLEEALTMILYEKLYAFVEIESLKSYFNEKGKRTAAIINNDQIPYKKLYKNIEKELRSVLNNNEEGKERDMISYLIEKYVRNAVGQYMESIWDGGGNE